jgi:hypothetical protein
VSPARSACRGRLAALGLALAAAACDRSAEPEVLGVNPPAVDALIVAGDSVFWLRSDATGLRLRGVAMQVLRHDGRFHELYTVDDDRSFYDAVFIGQGLYRRDLERGDSVLLVADTLIPRLAAAYQASHPRERPLRPDEPANEHARTVATVSYEALEVFGPVVTAAYRAEVDVVGGMSVWESRRVVLDAESGRAMTATQAFGRETAAALLRTARADLTATGESAAWRLDEGSFTLAGTQDTVLVTFEAVAADASYGETTLPLTPIAVAAPVWWQAAAGERPRRLEPSPEFGFGLVTLTVGLEDADGRSSLAVRDSADRRWEAGRVTGPVHRVYWLDSTVTDGTRDALRRAFDAAALYSGDARITRGPTPRRWPIVHLALWLPRSAPRR